MNILKELGIQNISLPKLFPSQNYVFLQLVFIVKSIFCTQVQEIKRFS